MTPNLPEQTCNHPKVIQLRKRVNYSKYFILETNKTSRATKVSSSYDLCVECFSQLSFDSEVYTKSATAADFV